ncbi:MAG: MmgE/PrpD family protein [Chloroflexi bacterium]|nr:MmgE/PrpD family protein [Chloroflexota bacterium]
MGATELVSKLIADFRLDTAPERAIAAAKQNILDTVGVSLAGMELDSGQIIAAYARERGGQPEASVIASGFRTSVENAALVDGVLAHAQLWEDNGTALVGHPSSPITSAILPVAEWRGVSGRDVIRAYLMGFELEVRFGRALNPLMYDLGWHNTSVIGTLGAAAAASCVLGLSAEQIRMAIGTAVSLASGTRQNFGTMTMPLHVGNAARNGVTAALLAEKGFNADPNSIEAPMGFATIYTAPGKHDLSKLTDGWAAPLEVINPGSMIKPYPSGGPTHNSIDAVLDVVHTEGVRPDDVVEIECCGPRWFTKTLIRTDPQRGIEGKTSLQFCVAAALVDREVTMRQFTDEKVRDPQIRAAMQKVRVSVHPEFAEDVVDFGTEVIVRLANGREHRRTVAKPKGHPENPLTRDELLSKYRQCADLVLTAAEREHSIELLENLEQLSDIRELCGIISLTGRAGG